MTLMTLRRKMQHLDPDPLTQKNPDPQLEV
jgi:hypothetical protein